MASSSSTLTSEVYKHYFDDPTLSDLTIGLSDRTVHVHRILLCRRSRYFETLVTGAFNETGPKIIDLHEDDPEAMMAVFRYIYDKPFDDLYKSSENPLQFLATVYTTGDKYQVQGLLENVTQQIGAVLEDIRPWVEVKWNRPIDDFLSALELMFAGTTTHDTTGRVAMVNFCVTYIHDLKKVARFSGTLESYSDLAAQIFRHNKLSLMLDGVWYCHGYEHREAVPRCPYCKEPFGASELGKLRNGRSLECDYCEVKAVPECAEDHDPQRVVWKPHE